MHGAYHWAVTPADGWTSVPRGRLVWSAALSGRDEAGSGHPPPRVAARRWCWRQSAESAARDEAHSATRERNAAKATAPAAAESSADGGVAQQRIGTGHGRREWAPVGRTGFIRASNRPAQVAELRYDDVDNLVAMGVLPRPYYARHPYPQPRAFPDGFVADPPH